MTLRASTTMSVKQAVCSQMFGCTPPPEMCVPVVMLTVLVSGRPTGSNCTQFAWTKGYGLMVTMVNNDHHGHHALKASSKQASNSRAVQRGPDTRRDSSIKCSSVHSGGVLRAELLLQRLHELVRPHAGLIILVHDVVADVHVHPVQKVVECFVEVDSGPLHSIHDPSAPQLSSKA